MDPNTKIRGLGLFRTAYYLPAITPLVIAAIIWKWVYQADYGLANYYLLKLHLISHPVVWLGSQNLAMPAVMAPPLDRMIRKLPANPR